MKKNNQSADNKPHQSTQQRRAALKCILVSGGLVSGTGALPKSWTRPVIDSVVLPSHAATTDDTGSGAPAPTPPPTVNYFWKREDREARLHDGKSEKALFAERVLDTLIPTASAGGTIPNGLPVNFDYICLAITGNTYSGTIGGRVAASSVYAEFTVNGTVGSVQALPDPTQHCGATSVQATTLLVDGVGPNQCNCTLQSSGTDFNQIVPQGDCDSLGFVCSD